ncbi:unnamed protein product [Cuscuta campestris]|uniref:Replication factor A C-terminal domain-containing protein n=1 Tax=Cuscuta campestris TaxID=132261 RepID=A0A484M6A5_9ASTE|nr:unnamed protein product [Cuscuta campestris]
MYGTRLLLNPEIEEVVAFRQRIVGVPTNRRPLELPCDDVTVVQQNEFLDATRMTTISLLKDGSEDGTYIVYATVVSVNNTGDWFYLACKCNRAVRADVDEDFLKLTKAATIETLIDCIEDGEYAAYGTIKDVDSDWFITVCRCGSEVVPRGGSYYCNECIKSRQELLTPRTVLLS